MSNLAIFSGSFAIYIAVGLVMYGALGIGLKDEFGDTDLVGFGFALLMWPVLPLVVLVLGAIWVVFVLPWKAGRWVSRKAQGAQQ